MSAPASPLSPSNSRASPQLSPCRRGSLAAPDPFGTLLVQNNERRMSSTLTITRAPPKTQIQDIDIKTWRRRSTGHHGRPISSGSYSGRISFAFSAFNPIPKEPNAGPRGTGNMSRPVSPFNPRVRHRSSSFTVVESSLTPMQVYELARQCNFPQSQPSTPDGCAPLPSAPVSYTPLPDTVYLPFLDRPREVEALISTPPTSIMFSLLAQTFPISFDAEEATEPAKWSYAKLERWLTKVDRSEAEDLEWVQNARTCISTRSELIWERIKGALGVPPEFDVFLGETLGNPGALELSSPLDNGKGAEEAQDLFEDAWVEPIVSTLSPGPSSQSPTAEFGHSPSICRQNTNRMQDISEDTPFHGPDPVSSKSTIHGLRIITSSLEPMARLESSPLPTSAGSFSHPHVPYDVIAERGPGNPLFPSSFANLTLTPTLIANNPALNSPIAPTPSACPCLHSMSRYRHRSPSWAEVWNPQRQEYAASVAATRSKMVE